MPNTATAPTPLQNLLHQPPATEVTTCELMREATVNLKGMVPIINNGSLAFRLAAAGERALNRHERRNIGRYYQLGLNDKQIAGVLATW